LYFDNIGGKELRINRIRSTGYQNVVSKAASHVGSVVKQVVEAGTSAVKTEDKDK
jgi:hypothetical protein